MRKKLLTYIKPSRGILALTAVLGLLGAIATISQMSFLSQIVNAVFLSHKGLAQVLLPLVLLIGVIILRACLLWAREVTSQRAAIRVKASLRERVFAHLLQLGPAFTRGERTGELAAVLNEGIERLDAYISRYLPQLVLSVLVPLLIIVVILPVDWFSAVLLLCTGPVIPLLMTLVGSNTQKRTQAQWATLSLMSAYFLDVMQGLTTLKLFGRSQAQSERIAYISNRFRDKTLQVLRYAFLSGAVLEFMTLTAIGVIATTLGVRLLNHSITFDKAFLILLLTPEFYRPLQDLGVQRHAAIEGEASAKRIFEILETPLPTTCRGRLIVPTASAKRSGARFNPSANSPQSPTILETPQNPAIDEPIPIGPITLNITDLTYTYPNKEMPALDHITLSLPANTCTALVGRSGAGKSTLINLLMRFMDATNGTICANSVPITSFSPDRWRNYLALVPQRPYLFYGTVRENIQLARPEATDNEVMQAAELAGVTAFIDELPQGLDTQVGEQGTQLSAGQAQRLAIARAILKNAPILILDEPTSSLDPDSEAHIRQSLTTLVRDRTVLVIAHRYNTIAHADHIIVLENGRIVEPDTQHALIQNCGPYANLIGSVKTSNGLSSLKGAGGATRNLGTGGGADDGWRPCLTQGGFLQEFSVHVEAGADGSGAGPLAGALRAPHLSSPFPKNPPPVREPSCLSGIPPAGWKATMKTFTRLLAFLSPFRWRIVLAILLGGMMIASSITLFGMAAYLIAAAALVPLLVFLSTPIYVVQLMGILRATSRYVERLVSHNTTFRLLANLRVWAYKRIEPQAPAHLLVNRSGDMLARLVADIEELQNVYLRVVSPIVVALVISLFTFGIFSIFSIGMSWVALAFLILAGLGVPFLAASLSRGLGKQQLRARAQLNTQVVDGLQGIQDVLAFGRSHAQLASVIASDRTLGQVQRRMARITGLQTGLNDLLMNTAMWVLIILAIPLVSTGYIDGVYLGTIGLLILASFEAVQPLASAFQGLGHARAAAERVFAATDAQPPVIEPAAPQPIPKSPEGYSLSFEHVHFTYSPGKREVLSDISFDLRPGTRVAIVGPSGSGKSTLVRLAVRFWDPTSGTICLNGQDIRRYSLRDLRDLIGVVAQDTYIFNDTLRTNLLLARPKASDAEIEAAVEQAQLTDFVRQLPQGLKTRVGEQGLQLSGGERQRLAIARALLKNAPILILDEVTANLDPLTERALLNTLNELTQGRTTLQITHRLLEMERMDEILVLYRGSIVERGTHDELLARGKLYRQLFDVQNGMLTCS